MFVRCGRRGFLLLELLDDGSEGGNADNNAAATVRFSTAPYDPYAA
jgi:hypothetical protein